MELCLALFWRILSEKVLQKDVSSQIFSQFASDYMDPDFPTIDIHVEAGRDHLTAKTMQVGRIWHKIACTQTRTHTHDSYHVTANVSLVPVT